ncbi:hypothetical protein [Ensifer adhaerens]|uniref:hypothetical protein n=1 Tax=Ensifer adhaerens TaxID=106592 RepID=UPI00098FD304
MDQGTGTDIAGAAGIAGARITIIVPALGAGSTEHVASHWARLGYGITVITLEAPATERYYKLDPRVSIERMDVPAERAGKLRAAFAKVAATHPEWKLVIWGDGEARQPLEAQRDALGLADRVEMPGVRRRCRWRQCRSGRDPGVDRSGQVSASPNLALV